MKRLARLLALLRPAGDGVSRRSFLTGGLAALVLGPERERAARSCGATPSNVAGPYWRPGAPLRSDLRGGIEGPELVIRGRVVGGPECRPLAGAVLDVWQADHEGRYDQDRADFVPERFLLRGRIETDADGRYEIRTIRPAPYGVMGRLRPAHVHFKVTAAGHAPLTTQLYFEGDANLDGDPIRQVRPALVRPVVDDAVTFDLALEPVTRAAYLSEIGPA